VKVKNDGQNIVALLKSE